MTFNELINQDRPTLVDVYATWCGPCKTMHPVIEQVKQQLGDSAGVIKIDIDQSETFARDYGIQAVPTLMIFKAGELVWRASGVHTAQQLIDLLRSHID